MNEYTMANFKVGLTASFQVTMTGALVDAFAEISGDISPLHMDDDFAKHSGQPGRVVHGLLTQSFVSKMVGLYLPGKHCLLLSVKSKFLTPVSIGDELSVEGEVVSLSEATGTATVRVDIYNQKKEKVCSSQAMVKLPL